MFKELGRGLAKDCRICETFLGLQQNLRTAQEEEHQARSNYLALCRPGSDGDCLPELDWESIDLIPAFDEHAVFLRCQDCLWETRSSR